MKIRVYVKRLASAMLSEDHELKLGQYNEFYLSVVDERHELWVVVADENGVETKLHLKR